MMLRTRRLRALIAGTAIAVGLVVGSPGTASAAGCDTTDPAGCMLPYPNNFFTKGSSKTPTKRLLALPSAGLPVNKAGVTVDPAEWNLLDGFSPGSMLVTYVPGVDLVRSKIAPVTAPQDYSKLDAGAVVIDTTTGKRHPIYGELDLIADSVSNQSLILRPLVNFTEGRTYVVALRNMKTASGGAIAPSSDFKKLRDKRATGTLAKRKAEFEAIFKATSRAGISRSSIYRAWAFTVASRESLTSRLVAIRDDAFAKLGDTNLRDRVVQGNSPTFTIDEARTRDYTEQQNQYLSRRVYGTIDVPCYLKKSGCGVATTLNLSPTTGLPTQIPGNVNKVPFVCNIPRSVAEGTIVKEKAFAFVYGHGLLGNYEAITGNDAYLKAGFDYKNIFCGLDWQGMSSNDLLTIGIGILPNLSNFKMLPDRLQQAHLNFLFLGRALIHPNGLASSPAFQFEGESVLSGQAGYSGDSQGGILGGATMAVAPDFRWGSLGVPGINYSTLLDRSIDWPDYGSILYQNYPRDSKVRPLIMALIQQLWDRGEGNGYAQHIGRAPLPNTPTNSVLLLPAFGDHQVSNLAAEVYARTIGAKLRTPAISTGRGGPFNWFWGITNGGSVDISGNAMLMMDTGPARPLDCNLLACAVLNPTVATDPCKGTGKGCKGTPPPPVGNEPPAFGQDPHGVGGDSAEIRRIVSTYVRTGVLPSGCGGKPCGIGGWDPAP
ncbi:MAG: hypothetical protein WCO96_03905 [Actinomycetes bacterium]